MAGSVNKVTLVGNLGKDPEIRRTNDGRPIANLSAWRRRKPQGATRTGASARKRLSGTASIFSEGLCKDRRAVPEEGARRFVFEGQLQTRNAGLGRTGNEKYRRGSRRRAQPWALTMFSTPAAAGVVGAMSLPTISARRAAAA